MDPTHPVGKEQQQEQRHGQADTNGQCLSGSIGRAFVTHQVEKCRGKAADYQYESDYNEDAHRVSHLKPELSQTWLNRIQEC